MNYWEFRKKYIVSQYKRRIEKKLKRSNFGEAILCLNFMEWLHSDNRYFDSEKKVISLYSLLDKEDFIGAVKETRHEGSVEIDLLNDEAKTPINKLALKKVLKERREHELQRGHQESTRYIEGLLSKFNLD